MAAKNRKSAKGKNRNIIMVSIILLAMILTIVFQVAAPRKGALRKNQSTETVNIAFTKHGELELINPQGELFKKLDIEIADTDYATQTGMMYRNSMEENQGMLFVFPNQQERYFYMKNTRISLDIIYLNSNAEVVSIQKNAEPYNESSLPSNAPAQYVLEIKGGLSDQWGIAPGWKIAWERK